MKPYKHPLGIPDEHMRMAGIIASQWECIEAMLERAVAEVIEIDRYRIAVLTTNLGFQTKCDIILLHARPLDPNNSEQNAIWKRFTKAYEGLKDAQELRSKFVHAKWLTDENNPDGPPLRNTVRTTGKKLTVDEDPVPIEEMYEAAETIWKNGEAFGELLQEFGLLQS